MQASCILEKKQMHLLKLMYVGVFKVTEYINIYHQINNIAVICLKIC